MKKDFLYLSISMTLIFAIGIQVSEQIGFCADDAASDYITLSLEAVELQKTGQFMRAWKIWDSLAADQKYPARWHALHLAASSRIAYLKEISDISERTYQDVYETAFTDLSTLKDNPDYPMQSTATRELANFLLFKEDWTRLLDLTSKIQLDSRYRYMQAEAYYHSGRLQEAERLTRGLFLKPDNTDIVKNVDDLYEKIMAALKKSFPSLTPQQIFQRGRALDAIGRRHEAAECYQQVIDKDISRDLSAEAMLFKAKVLYDTFQNDACLELYDRFLALYPGHTSTATVLMRKSIVYRRQGNDPKYLEMAATVADRHKGSRWANTVLIGRGDYHRSQGDWDKAESDYQRVIQSSGSDRDQAWWKWVWTAFNRGNTQTASERLAQMMMKYAASGWDLPMRYWRGRFYQLADAKPELYIAEYERLAANHAWEYYGAQASRLLNKPIPEPLAEPIPALTAQEKQSPYVQAAEFLEKLSFWDRAAAEWERGANRLQPISQGYFFRQMNSLVNTGKVAEARRQVMKKYDKAVNNGQIPRFAAEILYPFPERFRPFYQESTQRSGGLDPCLAAAVTLQESGFDQFALSHNLAGGLMQVMPKLFERLAADWPESPGVDEYMNPEFNVRAGVEYLAWLLERFDGSIPKALAGYNAGEHRVDGWIREYPYSDEIWIEHIPFLQTRMFVKKVMENYSCYSAIYPELGGSALFVDGRSEGSEAKEPR